MLLLLHGALGDSSQFTSLRDTLGVPTDSFDFEGHGQRPFGTTPMRMEQLADQALSHLDASGVERVTLFGYSMGGYVALLLAARVPDRVTGVATLGTRLDWSPEVAERESAQLDATVIRAKVPKFAEMLESRHAAAGWERVLDETISMMHALGSAPLLTSEQLESIQCPVRLCVGDRDATVTLEETRRAQRTIPNGELEVLPRTPHPYERVSTARLAFTLSEFVRV